VTYAFIGCAIDGSDSPASLAISPARSSGTLVLVCANNGSYDQPSPLVQRPRRVAAMPKRKATAKPPKSSKRPKHNDDSAAEGLWEAEGILEERRVHGKLQYLVQWKGRNPATGQDYEPTWEPVANCTKALIEPWQQQHPPEASGSASGSAERSRAKKQKKTPKQPRPSRQSRVVQSSPEPSTAHTESVLSHPSTPALEDTRSFASSAVTTPVDASTPSKRPSPRIQIPRGAAFDPDEYERFSQLAPTQPPTQSQTQDTDPESSQLSATAPEYQSSGIVPDSQSSAGEQSFVPATQQTAGTTQESSTEHESQEDVTEDSVRVRCHVQIDSFANNISQGLLEIVQQAGSRAPSPARSIPETIYDTSAESQSQRRPVDVEDPIEVSDTSEVIDSSSQLVIQQDQVDDSENAQPQSGEVPVAQEGQQQDEAITSTDQVAPPQDSIPAAPAQTEVSPSQDDSSSHLGVEETQPSGNTQHQDEALTSEERALPSFSSQAAPQPVEVDPSQDLAQSEEQQQQGQIPHRSSAPPDSVPEPTVAAVDETLQLPDSQPPATNTAPAPVVVEQESGPIANNQSGVQPAASQDSVGASLAEHLVLEQIAQFPFHSQHSLHDTSDTARPPASQPVRGDIEPPLVISTPAINGDNSRALQTERREVIPIETSVDSPIQAPQATPASSHHAPQDSLSANALLVSSTQAEDKRLLEEYLEPEFTRSQSPVVEAVQSTYASHSIVEEAVDRRDFAIDSQTPRSTNQSALSREQNAQIVPPINDLSTQEDALESIRPSVEKVDNTGRSTPDSRHDSSQDSPDRRLSFSPITRPPNYSLGTLDSNVPPRPKTPVLTSSLFTMETQDSGQQFRQQLQEQIAQRQAEKPFTPIRRGRRSNMTPATPTETPAATPLPVNSGRSLLRAAASPSVAATEGTRSPSTVPDRVPAPPVPTSLRTIALTQAIQAPKEETREETATVLNVDVDEPVQLPGVPAIVTTGPTVPEVLSSDNEELSDATDDDNASVLNDDLQLGIEEHIVPLFIEGRQCDEYSAHIKKNKELLRPFMKDPQNAKGLAEIEEVLLYLRAIETHFDLVFQEADVAVGDDLDGSTQMEFALEFAIQNSIKVKFLSALFHDMRQQEKHIVLVTQDDSNRLYDILETFCKASFIQYNMPIRGHQADPARVEGNLSITIFPSTASPIIRPADAIICLDGVQDAAQIRQKNWATNPDLNVVPVLHLVISRTVGHIERYLSSSLEKRERVHTILASLANMLGDIGKPIDEDMLRAPVAAAHVAEWLQSSEQERGEWPLRSIGSVKDVIEYQTQMSQASAASPAPERSKRPHDEEELDPAKRMRLTPQPREIISSSNSNNNENEVTRISDSMPGTAVDDATTLRAQLARMQEAFVKERSLREAEQARFHEQDIMWSKQQTVHEDLSREYRLLLSRKQELEEKVGTTSKNNETLRDRLATRTTEISTLTKQLDEQRNTHLLSEDAKITEITKLRKDVAEANAEKERAIKNAKTAESTLEYTNDQYRAAQSAATTSAATVAELEAQVAKLSHAASGEHAKLKSLHMSTQYKALATQNKSLKAENNIMKQTLKNKEEELARAKLSGRMGVGTRGSSVTPQPPKTRSRAASPLRPSNLRNG
jgi:hypothetical protein